MLLLWKTRLYLAKLRLVVDRDWMITSLNVIGIKLINHASHSNRA